MKHKFTHLMKKWLLRCLLEFSASKTEKKKNQIESGEKGWRINHSAVPLILHSTPTCPAAAAPSLVSWVSLVSQAPRNPPVHHS